MRTLILFFTFLLLTSAEAAPDPYQARFGRERPVIAILGSNHHTEISDFMLPYGVLKRADVADVLAVSTHTGMIGMSSGLQVQPDASLAEFDTIRMAPTTSSCRLCKAAKTPSCWPGLPRKRPRAGSWSASVTAR
jgi:hypothetical protein